MNAFHITSRSLSSLNSAWRINSKHFLPSLQRFIYNTPGCSSLGSCSRIASSSRLFTSTSQRISRASVEDFSHKKTSSTAHQESVELDLSGREVQIPLLWLRDHCLCHSCYNWDTFQKNVDNYSLDDLAMVESAVEGDSLSIKWQDGHTSQYSLQWLSNNFHTAGHQPERFLWDRQCMTNQPLPTTSFHSHMTSDDGLRNTLSNIIKYGFCVVAGVPATQEATEQVSTRISFIMETVYGRIDTMVSGQLDHSDTAYTSVPLGAHNDTTYFTVPAGIQVFHCLYHDGEGGETLLVDGFKAADTLRSTRPDSFDCLTSTVVPHEYKEGSHYHLYSLATVLSTHPTSGQLTQIRFNPYDRAPLTTLPADKMARFYSSYAALTDLIRTKESEFWIKLNPGMVLLVDNWRVMHGRSGFTGKRALCGCYLPRDDWMSRARVFGLM